MNLEHYRYFVAFV